MKCGVCEFSQFEAKVLNLADPLICLSSYRRAYEVKTRDEESGSSEDKKYEKSKPTTAFWLVFKCSLEFIGWEFLLATR